MRWKTARSNVRPASSGPGSARVSRVTPVRLGPMTSRRRGLFYKDCFGETPKPTRETRALPRIESRHGSWWIERSVARCHSNIAQGLCDPSTLQSAEIVALVCRQYVHPANRPISHHRDKTVFLFRSIPFSNSIDRKSHGPLAVTPAKSELR
jgi:hypothetical protein